MQTQDQILDPINPPQKSQNGHRRSKRFPVEVAVGVYGRTRDNRPFRDVTRTLAVNAYGGLLTLSAAVEEGQSLLLVNSFTQEERECRVVCVEPANDGRRKVGVEFTRPRGNFWHIYFPLVDRS